MYKYIRTGGNDTWENIYEVIGEDEFYWEIKDKSIPKCIALISKCNVTKSSDKLEDLVDTFIYAKCDYMELEEAKREKEWNESGWQQDGLPIFGAIWTEGSIDEPILKSVAKINDKGELELL